MFVSQEKLEWLKEIGAKEFEEPMKYCIGLNYLLSEKYINDTPLDKLKTDYQTTAKTWKGL